MKVVQKNLNRNKFSILDLDSLVIDKTLLFNIFIKRQDDYVIIIEAGTMLTKRLYTMLANKDKLYIAKEDVSKKALTHKELLKLVHNNKDNFQNTLALLYEINAQVYNDFTDSAVDAIDLTTTESIVQSIVYLVKEYPNYLKDAMQFFSIEYILSNHSLHVAIYAIHLGHKLNFQNEQLTQLGIAALLHDVGHKKIDALIIDKESDLSPQELQEVQKHPRYSGDIAKKNQINDPYILNAIVHHHEAHNGTGYPEQMQNKDISDFASILGICDVFDALTNDRAQRKKHSSFKAFTIMMKDENMANKFHKKYLGTFLQSFK